MASDTALVHRLGPDGQVAVEMGPGVTAYRYFVVHPERGGHPAFQAAEIELIKTWPPLAASRSEETP